MISTPNTPDAFHQPYAAQPDESSYFYTMRERFQICGCRQETGSKHFVENSKAFTQFVSTTNGGSFLFGGTRALMKWPSSTIIAKHSK